MNTGFNVFLEEHLKDPEFRAEYEALQPEHAIIQAMIDAQRNEYREHGDDSAVQPFHSAT